MGRTRSPHLDFPALTAADSVNPRDDVASILSGRLVPPSLRPAANGVPNEITANIDAAQATLRRAHMLGWTNMSMVSATRMLATAALAHAAAGRGLGDFAETGVAGGGTTLLMLLVLHGKHEKHTHHKLGLHGRPPASGLAAGGRRTQLTRLFACDSFQGLPKGTRQVRELLSPHPSPDLASHAASAGPRELHHADPGGARHAQLRLERQAGRRRLHSPIEGYFPCVPFPLLPFTTLRLPYAPYLPSPYLVKGRFAFSLARFHERLSHVEHALPGLTTRLQVGSHLASPLLSPRLASPLTSPRLSSLPHSSCRWCLAGSGTRCHRGPADAGVQVCTAAGKKDSCVRAPRSHGAA